MPRAAWGQGEQSLTPRKEYSMTRWQWFSIALVTSLCLALASPAVAAEKTPLTQQPQALPKPQLSVEKVEFSGQGKVWNLTPTDYALVDSPGVYEVRVLVKNAGPGNSPKGAKKCQIQVVGGKQVGTYGWSYNKTFQADVPALAPNEKKNCYVKLEPNLTDTGKYWVYAGLKP